MNIVPRSGLEITNVYAVAAELLTAAIGDLNIAQSCRTCGNMTSYCSQNPDACKGYVWRGLDRYKVLMAKENSMGRR